MDKPKITAKDFFLWAGALVSFYWSVIAFIFLIFDYINYSFPNPLSYYPADPYQSGISGEMASIIVLFPLFLWLMQIIRRDMSVDPTRKDIWIRRWALILTLFLAGVAIAGDLITLLTTFLNGEALTTAFLLKVLVILLVAAGVFMHFISDLKGYWDTYPSRRQWVRAGVGVVVLASILAGFWIVGTPGAARLARFDAQKVQDLQTIQQQVIYYWQAKQKLPATIDDLSNSLSYGPLPIDTQTGKTYGYQATGALSFKLCANFNTAHTELIAADPKPLQSFRNEPSGNWSHDSGTVCFDRTIDPAFYPPINK